MNILGTSFTHRKALMRLILDDTVTRHSAQHYVGASKPPLESGPLLLRKDTGRAMKRIFGVLQTNKDPLVEAVLQGRRENVVRLLSRQDSEQTDRQALSLARASCCNALYPIVSPREPNTANEINFWRARLSASEREIIDLDLQHKQGLVSDDAIVAKKIKQHAAQVAACKLQLERCVSQIEEDAFLHVRDGPSLKGR